MKRYMALFMAAVMSAGMVSNAMAASFADINDVPWSGAEQYINKAADLGIMVGDTDSTGKQVFRAKDRVTYCEAMQIAYSVLKQTGKLSTTVDTSAKWKSAMESANIPQWAYTAVAYGLESGIVSENDIKIFMKSATENRDATRENVAVIFGKALNHISPANAQATLSYRDKDEVTATSVPYIDLLARLNIMVGDENNDFNPKNYINRAEVAVIVAKSCEKIEELKNSGTTQDPPASAVSSVTGTIILTDNGTTEQTIAVSDSTTGAVTNFKVNSSTPVITADGSVKSYSDISLGDKVTVTTSGGVVVSVIIRDDVKAEDDEDDKKEKSLEGYINNISSKVITFDTKDGEQERYEFSSNPRITLNGSLVSQNDIYEYVLERSLIHVSVTLDDSGLVSSLVAEFCDVEGELTDVKDGKVYVKVPIGDNNKSVRVNIANDCEIYLDGTKISESKAEGLFDDDEEDGLFATVKVDNFNRAEKVEIFHDTYNNGELLSISSSKIKMKSGFGREVEYEYDDDVVFSLNGTESTYKSIKNALKDGDVLVTLEFSKDGLVTNVTAKAKEVKGTLRTADDKRITVVDEDDNRISADVDRNIVSIFNGEKISYSSFQKKFKDTENAVIAKVELNDEGLVEKVTATEGSDSEGTVIEISSSAIKFEDAAGVEHEYKVEPAARGYLNDQELFPATRVFEYAREKGSTVKVTFSSRGYVNRIYVTTED